MKPAPKSPRRTVWFLAALAVPAFRPPPARLWALGLFCALLILALWATPGFAREHQAASEDAADVPDPAVELEPLLRSDTGQWLEALEILRTNPEQTRELLVLAVEQDLELPNRWRIFHHMGEFGRMEDIPVLLARLATAEEPRERAALGGSAQALYWPTDRGAQLPFVVEEFSFLQTRPPAALEGSKAGRLAMSAEVYRRLHGEGLPIAVIRKLQALRGKTYGSRKRLSTALARTLGKKGWETHQKLLLAVVEEVPERVAWEGTLRVGLRNSLQRPVMFRVAFDVWYGRFDPAPKPLFVFVEASSSGQGEIRVRIVKSRDREEVRVDMRLWEVHGEFQPAFQKLYVGR